jgi:hypothetical protein
MPLENWQEAKCQWKTNIKNENNQAYNLHEGDEASEIQIGTKKESLHHLMSAVKRHCLLFGHEKPTEYIYRFSSLILKNGFIRNRVS